VIEVPLPKEGPPPIPGAAEPTGGAETQGAPPEQIEAKVQADLQVTKSAPAPGDQMVSELAVKLGSGLEPVNKAITGQGIKPIPDQVLLRVVTDSTGKIIAVDSATPGVSPEIAEALAAQSVQVVRSGGLRFSAVEGVGFGLTLLFALKAGYDIGSAPEGQRVRVATGHAGGFVGGMAAGYLICNLVLGLPTAGWSLLICGLAAGVPGGMAGSAAADVVYEEATINDDQIRTWVRSQDVATLAGLPALTKAGYIGTLMHGWISDADVTAIETICAAIPSAEEMRLLRDLLDAQIRRMRNIGQRTRVRLALDRL
jgi:hypothetical protein